MPTVVRVRGFRVFVNVVEDGDGPHVHVSKGGREYRVALAAAEARVISRGGREKTTNAEAREVEQIVECHLFACWREWKKWHR